MRFSVDGFDWDDGNLAKCEKHGVPRDAIEGVFHREVHVFPDPTHSRTETRYLAIGTTQAGRHVFLAFTLRERDGLHLIRPISARYMHPKEVTHYEAQVAKPRE